MVDNEFEAYLNNKLKDYVTLEEYERRWEEHRASNQRFIDSSDRYLRDIERNATTLLQRVEMVVATLADSIRIRNEKLDRAVDKIEEIDTRQIRAEQNIAAMQDDMYGNINRPDTHPSIMRMMAIRSEKADQQYDELMAEIKNMKVQVARWQGIFDTLTKAIKKAGEFLFRTLVGRIILGVAALYTSLRAIDPVGFDAFILQILKGLNIAP